MDRAGSERLSTLTASPMMKSSPQAARIPSRIVHENRIRASNEPPHASVRRFDHGVQN